MRLTRGLRRLICLLRGHRWEEEYRPAGRVKFTAKGMPIGGGEVWERVLACGRCGEEGPTFVTRTVKPHRWD